MTFSIDITPKQKKKSHKYLHMYDLFYYIQTRAQITIQLFNYDRYRLVRDRQKP